MTRIQLTALWAVFRVRGPRQLCSGPDRIPRRKWLYAFFDDVACPL